MITGKLVLGNLEAVVDGDWTCSDQLLQDYLRLRFPISGSPADGHRGMMQVMQAAVALEGVAIPAVHGPSPGRVY